MPSLVHVRPPGVARHLSELYAFVTFSVNFLVTSSSSSCPQVKLLNQFSGIMAKMTHIS
jgi:hypothetical protein